MELSNIWPRQPRFTQEARDYHHRTNKAQIGNKLKKHEGRYDNIIILMCCFLFFRLWRQHVTALNDKNDYLKKKEQPRARDDEERNNQSFTGAHGKCVR